MLAVRDLAKSFGPAMALDGVDLDCPAGALTVLLGPNGAGKSTTMRCVAGLLQPDRGRVEVHGRSIFDRSARLRVGYVAEEPAMFPGLTTWESLGFIGRLYRIDDWRPKAERLLARYDLAEQRDRLARDLSQGQRRKLALAMALLIESPLVLLDEPFNGLDPEAQRVLRLELKSLCDQGTALLVSTHRLAEAEAMADHFIVIRSGRVVAKGTMSDLLARVPTSKSLEEVYFALASP